MIGQPYGSAPETQDDNRARRADSTSFMLRILLATGIISPACIDADRCTAGERWTTIALGVIWLMGCAWLITPGWRGKLFGARLRASNQPDSPPANAAAG
jgi:hypothetical protein